MKAFPNTFQWSHNSQIYVSGTDQYNVIGLHYLLLAYQCYGTCQPQAAEHQVSVTWEDVLHRAES